MFISPKQIFVRIREPLFLLFVAIALAAWYLNRLNNTYQQDIHLPIYIEGIKNPTLSAGNDYFNLYCRVRAKGYDFLLYKLLPKSKMVTIPISEILSASSTSENPTINMSMLETAVSDRLKSIELIKLHETNLKIANIAYSEKYVKIASDIKLKIQGGYMQIGEVKFDPCSVLVRGNERYIENIDSVFTYKKVITTPFNTLSDEIGLQKQDGVSYSPEIVEYHIIVDRFTEHKISAPPKIITTDSLTEISEYTIIPSKIDLCFNVAQSINQLFSANSFELYIDYDSSQKAIEEGNYIGNNLYKVKVRNLPLEVTLRYIEPSYVTVLKQE